MIALRPQPVDLGMLRHRAVFTALFGSVMADVYELAWRSQAIFMVVVPGHGRRLWVGTSSTPDGPRDIFAWWDGRSDWVTRSFGPPWLSTADRGYELRRVHL